MRLAGKLGLWFALTLGLLAQAVRAETVQVGILDYKYQPAQLQIKAGTTVKWVNNEKRVSHSILFRGPGGFESERIFPGESWERRFDKPGSYPYACGPHPEMAGSIEVVP
ncbi:plastocyanin [Burkholderiales bacterium]|nr:MAG: plastocyanin [Burkholderiales bacterium]CAG1011403.1 plastocyanin [Burkholderiales bacterium]